MRAELPHLAAKPRRLQRAFNRCRDLVEVEWFVRKVVGAELHGFDGRFHTRVRGEQNDKDVLVELLDLAQHRDAVGIGKAIVEQDEIHALGKLLEGGASGLRLEHLVPVGLQAFAQGPANQGFVIDDKNGGVWHMTDPKGSMDVRSTQVARTVPPGERVITCDFALCRPRTGEFSAALRNFTRRAGWLMQPAQARSRIARRPVTRSIWMRYATSL